MKVLEVYKKSANILPSPVRKSIHRAFFKGIGKEWRHIRSLGNKIYIGLSDAISWIEKSNISPKQLKNAHVYFLGRFLKNNPFFIKQVHYVVYCGLVHLTLEGFRYWCMRQKTAKALLIQARFAMMLGNISPGSNKENTPPAKKRKVGSNLKWVPKKLNFTTPTKSLKKVGNRLIEKHVDFAELKVSLEKEEVENQKLYFIREKGTDYRYKIGITTRPLKNRIAELKTGNPDTLEVYDSIIYKEPRTLEKFFHAMFEKQLIRDEWFALTAAKIQGLISFMKS
jgi:hypothetical protein